MADDEIEYDYGDENDDGVISLSDGHKPAAGAVPAEAAGGQVADTSRRRARSSRSPPHRSASRGEGPSRRPAPSAHQYPSQQHQHLQLSQSHHRYFVLKCEYYSIIAQAKRTRVWPARRVIADRFASLTTPSSSSSSSSAGAPPRITFFFTLEKAKCFVAMGELPDGARIAEAGRFSEVPVRWLAVRDVFFESLAGEGAIPRELFSEPTGSTVRDGVELPYSVGRAIERAFYDEGDQFLRRDPLASQLPPPPPHYHHRDTHREPRELQPQHPHRDHPPRDHHHHQHHHSSANPAKRYYHEDRYH